MGETPEKAFFVKRDGKPTRRRSSTGQLIVETGPAPVKPSG